MSEKCVSRPPRIPDVLHKLPRASTPDLCDHLNWTIIKLHSCVGILSQISLTCIGLLES